MKKVVFTLAIFSFLVFLVAAGVFFLVNKSLERNELYAGVNVTANIGGFDLNGSALTFGKVSLGGSSTRNVLFTNEYDFPIIVRINSEGDISKLLDYEEEVRFETGESGKISMSVSAPPDLDLGTYEGSVYFDIRRSLT